NVQHQQQSVVVRANSLTFLHEVARNYHACCGQN
ncbi:MAG: hypothetical protein ACI89J_001261, partial [Hyphomicrobiaceae bacterium]